MGVSALYTERALYTMNNKLLCGKPVVSMPIQDVIHLYGEQELVQIAATVPEFIAAIEAAFDQGNSQEWLRRVDYGLDQTSWDCTWSDMKQLLDTFISRPDRVANNKVTVRQKDETKCSTI